MTKTPAYYRHTSLQSIAREVLIDPEATVRERAMAERIHHNTRRSGETLPSSNDLP